MMEEIMEMAKLDMDAAIEHLQNELVKVRTGKASASMLGGIVVSYYGTPTPLNQVSNISASDSRTLNIQPWEKNMLGPIEKAIFEANLGITPQNNGEMVILNIPPLTEERRKELVKKSKSLAEDSKVGVRQARRDAIDEIKKEVKNGFPEDAGKKKEEEVQELTNKYTAKIDNLIKAKEADIMKI
ncbi:MAG: ribosome recycling factor [Saprospiraceae bacterium]|nr:ribosome recycling factor [Saprospiraceae bacterium]